MEEIFSMLKKAKVLYEQHGIIVIQMPCDTKSQKKLYGIQIVKCL